MPRQPLRSIAAALIATVAIAAALALGYLAAGTIAGMLPANPAWHPPARGITIWVETNGIHTGLVLPKRAAGIDWRPMLPARDLADPRYAGHDHAAFGWGERAFYVETPTWADVRPAIVIAAALGSSRTLLHVDHLPRPAAAADSRPLVLRPREYRRLVAFLMATRARSGAPVRGYGGRDVFYPAHGRYSAIHTCNAWTGDALRFAGVRIGRWTPFPWSVMRWFG